MFGTAQAPSPDRAKGDNTNSTMEQIRKRIIIRTRHFFKRAFVTLFSVGRIESRRDQMLARASN
jgi:hypothetical protein